MARRTIYARAQPKSVRLKETYCYNLEVSRNPFTQPAEPPRGTIEVVVPYDGHRYFTRRACNDVKHQLGGASLHPGVDALIGHLGLANYGRTNLEHILDLNGHYGSVPLQVCVTCEDAGTVDQLLDDRHSYVIEHHYSPAWPRVFPIGIDMELLDEDSLGSPAPQLSGSWRDSQLGDVVAQIAQQVNFRRNLLLVTRVKLNLPGQPGPDAPSPRITRMSVGWPTITSLRALHLVVGDEDVRITYNPLTRSLQWAAIPMQPSPESPDTSLQSYVSDPMLLLIDQPGELYQQASSHGRVEVEIPGRLLSGLKARQYNGIGAFSNERQAELTTCLVANLHLILDDAFTRRTLSPYQHLHFDEVIPDAMRIADIRTALADRGFRIGRDESLPCGPDQLRHLILAQRPDGPDIMQMWLFIEGKRYTTERQTEVPGGQTFTSTFESGELKVYMRGELPSDSRGLTEEMNALQMALRDRFERLRAKR
jgi:hypothetical protein